MFLENLSISEAIMFNIIILLILLGFFVFKWFLDRITEVSKEPSTYLMFIQLIFVFMSCGVFVTIFLYYIIIDPKAKIDVLTLFLTIVVGFMGTIMGLFFSQRAFEKMITDLEDRNKSKKEAIKIAMGVLRRLNTKK